MIKKIILKNRILYNICRGISDGIAYNKLQRFVNHYKKNKSKIVERIQSSECIEIKYGKYSYKTFSAFYLNNMIGLYIELLIKGKKPYLNYTILSEKSNNWSDFFKQPIDFDNYAPKLTFKKYNNSLKPNFKTIYRPKELKLWCYIYNEFIHLNSYCKEYVEKEYRVIIEGKRVLGVICRGTDYIATKPKYHPVQPTVDEVVLEAKRVMKMNKYDYIYLATEEESIVEQFIRELGKEKVLTNARKYYDKAYSHMDKNSLLYQVNFKRENDQFYKGLEYLSSMILLSRCSALIGGHCGGTDLALFFNNLQYEYVHIFNKGVY